jgi:O-antigen ligase/tetratricopeptide (TPR) repeat protein
VCGTAALCAVIFCAPLLVGSVHRPVVVAVMLFAALALCLLVSAEILGRRALRVTSAVLLLVALLAVPLVQSLPLPAGLSRRIDPAADLLLAESPVYGSPLRPLSLDPPETRAVVGRMGAVLAIFVAAFHLASGRSRRQLLLRMVASSALAALVIGLGHRMLGEDKIYGTFMGSRGLLNGPFINPNHNAQFLELGAFVCVACALVGASALNRVGWLTAAALLGAGALGTLSRGALLGLGAGTILFICLRNPAPDEQSAEPPRRGSMFWIGIMVLVLGVVAVSLGADQILTRVGGTHVGQEARLELWRDSLRILWAHPFGIGRGAFARVFPIYRTMEGNIAVRFDFIENEPLQYLIEMGWVGFLAVIAALIFVVRGAARVRRRDPIETALAAALVAVLVHNLVDFGLETLGIQIPFAAVLGTLLGRARNVERRVWAPPRIALVCAAAVVAVGIGVGSLASANAADFDAQLKGAATPEAKRQLALDAQAAHPLDYFYVLSQASAEPLEADAAGRSPRLHALNHALLLCPRCPDVHVAVASTLWALNKRSQALGEWRSAVATRPVLFEAILKQVWSLGAHPPELATLAGSNAGRLVATASFLGDRQQRAYARKLLPLATAAGASPLEVLLIAAKMDIEDGLIAQGLKDLGAAEKIDRKDPRIFLLRGDAQIRAGQVDAALQALEAGLRLNPEDLPLQRKRLALVLGYGKYHLADQALAGLELALREAHQSTAELHLMTARFHAALRNYAKAGTEYGLVLTQDRDNSLVWLELARLWETAGREVPALEAYREARRIEPANPTTVAAIERIETHRRQERLAMPAGY